MKPFVEINSVSILDGDRRFCNSVNLEFGLGEIVIILGSYSSGGEHLVKALAGIIKPDEGEIKIGGENIFPDSFIEQTRIRKKTSFVFSNGGLISNLNIEQNLLLPLNIHYPNLSLQSKKTKILSLLTEYGLSDVLEKRPSDLQLDKRKLVSLLRAIVTEPELILMHEPLANLSLESKDSILFILKRIRAEKKTIIINTHIQDILTDYADRAIVMENGEICFNGSADELK